MQFTRPLAAFRRMTVGDNNVDIRTYGVSGPEVVLIHGIGASGRYFAPLIQELAGSAVVHTVELPGFGSTSTPHRRMAMADFAAVAVQALRDAGIRGAQWVGHSMGCQVVAEMAIAAPAETSSVVLIGPTTNNAERSAPLQALRLAQDTLIEPLPVKWILFSDYLRAGPRWYLKTVPGMVGHRLEERLPLVQPPVLVLRGGRDPIARDGWLDRLAEARPGTRTAALPGQPHVCMYTDPAGTAALLRNEPGQADGTPG